MTSEKGRIMIRILYILLMVVMVCANTSFAASFDCAKAKTAQETIICSDSSLSNLDDQLDKAYLSAMWRVGDTGIIKRQQREWVRTIRNNCTSKTCLKEAYGKRIKELNTEGSDKSASNSICPITEKSLIAGWERVSDDGYFEEMAFEYEGSKRVFNSWLHHRPEIPNGSWKFENCTIFIAHPDVKDMKFTLKVVKAQKDRIYLRDPGDKNYAVYKRIKE